MCKNKLTEYVATSELLENLAASASSTSMPLITGAYTTTVPPRSFQPRIKKVKNRSLGQSSLLSLKKKKLMVKRIELLNHKTILEIALLEKQLGVPFSNHTLSIIEESHNGNNDHSKYEHAEFSTNIKEENHLLNFDEH